MTNNDVFEVVMNGEFYEVSVVKSERKITLQKFLKNLNEIEAMYAINLVDNQTGEIVYEMNSSLGLPPCFENIAVKKIVTNYWDRKITVRI